MWKGRYNPLNKMKKEGCLFDDDLFYYLSSEGFIDT
jgi:hypothetical protein